MHNALEIKEKNSPHLEIIRSQKQTCYLTFPS